MSVIDENQGVSGVDAMLREWLADPDVMLIVGDWERGVVAEILPRGKARLTQAGYEGRFDGLRDLRIEGEGHHMHLDLAKIEGVRYTVRGSVCYGWRPSLELDLLGPDGKPSFSLSAGELYRKQGLRSDVAARYFQRLFDHRRRYGAFVDAFVRPTRAPVQAVFEAWRDVAGCFCEPLSFDPEDPVGALSKALATAVEGVDRER